jgi:hypothetical protein
MMKYLCAALLGLILFCGAASGQEQEPFPYHACLCYWYEQNVGPLPRDPMAVLKLWDVTEKGVTVWNVPERAQPPRAELEAIQPQAIAWFHEREENRRADFRELNDDRLSAMVGVLLDEINILRRQLQMPELSRGDLRAKVKDKQKLDAKEQ